MKTLYWENTGGGVFAGDLFFVRKNANWPGTPHRVDISNYYYLLKPDETDNSHSPAILFEIDEIEPDNFLVMADILATIGKKDINGRTKYNVQAGELYELVDWEIYEDGILFTGDIIYAGDPAKYEKVILAIHPYRERLEELGDGSLAKSKLIVEMSEIIPDHRDELIARIMQELGMK